MALASGGGAESPREGLKCLLSRGCLCQERGEQPREPEDEAEEG